MIYTRKQRALMGKWQRNELQRINLLEGSVSSGKTWISLVLWAFWVKTMPDAPDYLYLMSARSLTTLKRNCLLLLQSLVGEDNFKFSIAAKEGWLFGRHILLEGANDSQAEAKIRGLTLQGAYCDEATKLPRDFFNMLLSRLRKPGAKLIATTNPDAPGHWLKTEYIDRADEIDIYVEKFVIDDNTTLPTDYVENIKKEYTGVFYERFILGLWVLAEGLIYPMYREAIKEPPKDQEPSEYCLSIDYGTQNAFSAGLWGRYGTIWWRVDEYYYSGRDTGIQKTDEEYAQDLNKWLAFLFEPVEQTGIAKYDSLKKLPTIIDPSAASFIALLRKRGNYKVLQADNDVADGIRETATALKLGLMKIAPWCKAWISEAGGYVWDENAVEDAPVKINDHCLTGDTLVETTSGPVPIAELVGQRGLVYCFDEKTSKPTISTFHDVRQTGTEEIYEITLEDGRILKCSGEHPILTQRGWVNADSLTFEDQIINIGLQA